MTILKTFATQMRAGSLQDDLQKAGIFSTAERPKHVNKRLPPPNVEVKVKGEDLAGAKEVLKDFMSA